ncbi:MAG: GTP-binding protein [Bacteroidales bacterium]|nr:GTP-binding protein [Bacteroidales bacterium]
MNPALARIDECKNKKSNVLNLSNLSLMSIPEQVWELKHINTLKLSNNALTEIPERISELKDLVYLICDNNNITKVSFAIRNLDNLLYLILSRNNLNAIPIEITSLKSLARLDISYNEIEELPIEIQRLTNLRTLILDHNHLSRLPLTIGKLDRLKSISLEGNNLAIPPLEVIHRGGEAVVNYFRQIVDSDTTQIFEAKMLVVGEGGVGKTYLVNRIISDDVSEDTITTEGIKIKSIYLETANDKDYRINIWDFGGQEIYHSTHQFFLTKRSLYLFVWEARKDDNLLSFDYWLNVVSLLSSNSPLIIVLNKIDERIRMIDEASIKEKFPNIVGFFRVSALKGTGINELRNRLWEEFASLEHIGDLLPLVWSNVRDELERIDENYIEFNKYLEICESYGLNKQQSRFLSQYYHDLGVFLHFDRTYILETLIFLKPEWATSAVYQLVDNKEVIKNYGKFNYEFLKEAWKDYPEDRHIYFVELMKKFEICFQIPQSRDFIIPSLLSETFPQIDWDYNNNLRFEYLYDFMPKGIIPRLTVRMNDLISNNLFWKNGIVIFRDNTYGLIVCEPLKRCIRIWIKGNDKNMLLELIRREIDYINKSLNNPKITELLPCICKECINSIAPYFHSYLKLKKAQERGKSEIECQNSFMDVNISTVLGIIENNNISKNDKIIISSISINGGQTIISDNIDNINYKR